MIAEIPMSDGTTYRLSTLLTASASNAKLAKGRTKAMTVGLTLSPHNASGVLNVCRSSTPGCRSVCLHRSGMTHAEWAPGRMIVRARVARTVLYQSDRPTFLAMLRRELIVWERRAARAGLLLAFRPNVTSDLDWARVHPDLLAEFPRVQWYGYTKVISAYERFLTGRYPRNYHLTFSRSETNETACLGFLRRGGHVAVPFAVRYSNNPTHPSYETLPAEWHGFTVIDGDKDDHRWTDPAGPVVVGLRAKGHARGNAPAESFGFVVKV